MVGSRMALRRELVISECCIGWSASSPAYSASHLDISQHCVCSPSLSPCQPSVADTWSDIPPLFSALCPGQTLQVSVHEPV